MNNSAFHIQQTIRDCRVDRAGCSLLKGKRLFKDAVIDIVAKKGAIEGLY